MIFENLFDLPVFKYTSVIIKDNGNMDFCTTVKKFQNDIETLLENGYISISLEEYNNRRIFNTPTTKKEFCLIFEGGFADNYSVVFPILQQYNIKASIFISTDLVGVEKRPNSPNFITGSAFLVFNCYYFTFVHRLTSFLEY